MGAPLPPGFSKLPTYAEGQAIAGASSAGVLGPNGIRAWTHDASGVRLVQFATPGPLVSLQILVGTQPVSNAGQPHTLEHIVFMGSHNHPARGYLDNLACRCLANDTNAWTANEYTAYTARTVGFDGFSQLLPCYLDHVLRPRINQASFASEVYHIRGDGKEAGVVFCEMHARENTEGDLLDRTLKAALFHGTPLAFEAGGLCNEIRQLSNEDIANFHRDQYCGANVTVIVGGDSLDHIALMESVRPLLDSIASQPGYNRGQPQWSEPLHLEPLPTVTRKTIHFPSSEEEIGTVTLAWRGPGAEDREAITAIDVILRYLAAEVWSPLRQEYVEIEDQLASDIDVQLEIYLQVSGFSLVFSGVQHKDGDEEEDDASFTEEELPDEMNGQEHAANGDMDHDSVATTEDEHDSVLLSGHLEHQVVEFLADIVKAGELPGGMRAMQAAIKKEAEVQLTELESGSHDAVPDHLIQEVVYGQKESMPIGAAVRGFLSTFADLERRDEQFWINLLDKYFVSAPRIELVMVPDASVAKALAEEECKAHLDRVEHIGKEALAKLGDENEARISTLKAPIFSPDMFPPLPSTSNVSRWPYTVTRETTPGYYSQSVTIETDFVHCTIFLDTTSMTAEQRCLLPILCELIPTCDILLEDGSYIPYTDHTRAESEATVSTEVSGLSMGLSGGLAHQCLVLHFAAMPASFSEASEVMLQTLFQAEVTAERLSAVSQTLAASVTSEMRDGDSVLDAAAFVIPFLEAQPAWDGELPNYIFANLFGGASVLNLISGEFSRKKAQKAVRRKFLRKMHETLECVRTLPCSDIFIQVAARDPKPAHDALYSIWKRKREEFAPGFAQRASIVRSELPLSRRIGGCLGDLLGSGGAGKVIGISGVESCSMDVRVDTPVHTGHPSWSSLKVLIAMLCRMEGPLTNAVRGAGLAYGVDLGNWNWMGYLVGEISDSSSPAVAWDAVCTCLEKFRISLDEDPEKSGLGVDLETAKASMLFSLNRCRSTPENVATGALLHTAVGVPAGPLTDRALEEAVEKVTLQSLREAFDAHVARLCRAEGRLFVVTCGESEVQDVIASFRKCKRPVYLEEGSLDELLPPLVQDTVVRAFI